jgi:hypothetical protein
MDHWRRSWIPSGFEWISGDTGTHVTIRVKDSRWMATLSVLLASGERHTTEFFAEDSYRASLEKCLLYLWRAMIVTDKSTFDLDEAMVDLQRFAS